MNSFISKLLRVELPSASVTADVDPPEFFDRAETIAKRNSWRIERRREYAGEGYDQLNLHLGQGQEAPMLRMVSTPQGGRKINTDVVARWASSGPDYDEYVRMLRHATRALLAEYNSEYNTRVRLGMPRKPLEWDPSAVDCMRLDYVREKFDGAVRSLALGEGDIRRRLESAYLALHVLRADDLPAPLRPHWEWVVKELTHRPARHRSEGTLHATLSQMKNSKGATIAERIYHIRGALHELCPDEHYWMTD